MQSAGYQTWHMGKSGETNAFAPGLRAFETTIADEGKGGERVGSSRCHADRAIEFLKSRATANETKPFYIYIAPPVPHDPRVAEPEFHKLYDAAKIPLSPAFLPQHPFDNGEMTVAMKNSPPGRVPRPILSSNLPTTTRPSRDSISADNGLSMGDHGLFGKQNLYEFGGMHVPCVIAGPGITKGKSDAFVYLMDLFPTFAELGGAKIPEGVDGKSLVPILSGKQAKVRDVLYTGYRECQRSIRDDRWKLIRYPLVDRTQLFDLCVDPLELVNLSEKPEHAAKVAELTALLQREMTAYSDKHPLTVAEPKPAEWTPPAAKSESKKKFKAE